MLMKEFLTETGTLQREASDQNTDAGIAWAKFHAVHPRIAKDELSDCTVARLMSDRGLNLLGTTKEINSSSPQRFYQELQKYVDSKEKITKKEKKDKLKPAFEMEYWPLIKVVNIYTKAPALSTGAVIVDLPGVHDSNAARAAVAQGYIKQCTGLWIVAPITRAIDDKAAKTLLGDSFKPQLKYDGGFSNVTFICSRTDDISITEAIDTLQLEDDVENLYAEQTQLEQHIQQTKEKMEDLKESPRVFQLVAREAADDIEVWEELQDRHDNGKAVYAPASRKSKRKKSDGAKRARKKRQADAEDSDADFVVVDDEMTETEDEDSDDDEVQAPKEQLTEQDIKNKLKELRETKKNARRDGLQMKPLIEELRPHIRKAQKKINSIKAEVSKICISGRNEYSREAIQNDFAAGIKEIDQENAAEEDEDSFNPDEDQRDYDEVARSLPVFCVSSRAYQKMCGRLQKDDEVPGFNTPDETQIPQLQRHCTKLTEAGRVQTCRNFLSSVCQLLTTFTLWASNDGTGINLTDEDKQKQVRYIDGRLKELEEGLEACVKACINVMKREMNDQIFDKYPDLIREAIEAAPQTAESWGAHRSEGGLAWSTYKATVRRNGKYESKAAGHRDFNLQLIDPIVRKLATGWERAFQNRLPRAFTSYVADSGKVLRKSHEAVEQRARQNGVGLASLSALKTQIVNYEALFGELNQLLIASMTEQQRQANRDFSPTIAGIMQHVYDICVNESGPGSFKRMKDAMVGYVDQHRHNMFNHATMTVKHHLDMMCRSLQELMETRSDEIYIRMKADYMRVLGGVEVRQGAVMSREERHLRSEIMEKLRAVDSHFESISKGEITPADEGTAARRKSPATDGGGSIAFESAPESVHQDTAPREGDSAMQESIMRDQDDSSIVDTSPATLKRSKLPTPFSSEGSDAEL